MMFGAPVSVQLHEQLQAILTNGSTYTPYGATECLPVTWISGTEILQNCAHKTLKGAGTCIGVSVPETEIRIVESSLESLQPYQVGEIIVSGKQATREYYEHEEETKKAKILDSNTFWHRMGDLGYKDESGLLWFCGRKAHQVQTHNRVYYPINCEAIFNQHPLVKRSALIRHKEKAAIVIERKDARTDLNSKELAFLRSGLLALGRGFDHTREIDTFFLYKSFPVDCRHNIKIDRLFLSKHFETRQNLLF
jgi:acyl-CoA synthetase (AMP-forming)/AMP-acid ligase II